MNGLLIKLASFSAQKALLIGGMITAFWYFTVFNDGAELHSKIDVLDKTIKEEKSKEQESDAALKEIAAVQASVGALSDQFKLVSAQLPTDIQMAEIIRTVDKVSQATGLNVKTKEPKPSERKDVIEIMPLHVTAEGGFNEVTMFFYYLSTIERIVRVKSFIITAPNEFKKTTKLNLDADVVSYKFIGVEPPKPAEAVK